VPLHDLPSQSAGNVGHGGIARHLPGDISPLHQQGKLLGHCRRIRRTGISSQLMDDRFHRLLVSGGCLVRGVVGLGELYSHVHEEASIVVLAIEELIERIEDRQQLSAGRIATVATKHLLERISPPGVVPAEHLADQVILAVKMEIERGLGHADLRKDGVEPDRVKPDPVEQIVRNLEYSIPSGTSHGSVQCG